MNILLLRNTYPFRKKLKGKFRMKWDPQNNMWFKKNITLQASKDIIKFCKKNKIGYHYKKSNGITDTYLPPVSTSRISVPSVSTSRISFPFHFCFWRIGYRGFKRKRFKKKRR